MDLPFLLGITKSKVLELVLIRRRTAQEAASVLKIQVNAARKHLESLKEDGLIKEEYVVDGVGRPKKFYLMTGRGRELYQNQYSAILDLVLRKITLNHGSRNADHIIRETADEISKSFSSDSETNKRKKIERLVTSLDKFGFETSLEEDVNSFAIISRNCPIREIANNHQKLVCHGLHDEIIKSALGADNVKLEKCMALNDNLCRHVLSK